MTLRNENALEKLLVTMSGIELSEKLLENNPDRRIILYTGFDTEVSLDLFTKSGVKGIINKTATQSELVNLIKHILNGQTLVPLSIFKNQNNAYTDK